MSLELDKLIQDVIKGLLYGSLIGTVLGFIFVTFLFIKGYFEERKAKK